MKSVVYQCSEITVRRKNQLYSNCKTVKLIWPCVPDKWCIADPQAGSGPKIPCSPRPCCIQCTWRLLVFALHMAPPHPSLVQDCIMREEGHCMWCRSQFNWNMWQVLFAVRVPGCALHVVPPQPVQDTHHRQNSARLGEWVAPCAAQILDWLGWAPCTVHVPGPGPAAYGSAQTQGQPGGPDNGICRPYPVFWHPCCKIHLPVCELNLYNISPSWRRMFFQLQDFLVFTAILQNKLNPGPTTTDFSWSRISPILFYLWGLQACYKKSIKYWNRVLKPFFRMPFILNIWWLFQVGRGYELAFKTNGFEMCVYLSIYTYRYLYLYMSTSTDLSIYMSISTDV